MRPLVPALLVVACLLLAGCAREGEAREDPRVLDRGDYAAGPGIALAANNTAPEPFTLDIVVLGAGQEEVARLEGTVAAGGSLEKWFALERPSTYSARLSYAWTGDDGRTAAGADEQLFRSSDCPTLTRLAWELRRDGDMVGVAFLGSSCASADDAAE